MKHLCLRLTCAAIAALCLGGAAEIYRLDPRRSGLALVVFIAALAGAGLSAAIAVVPAKRLGGVRGAVGGFTAAFENARPPNARWIGITLFAIATVIYALLASWFVPLHQKYLDNDQGAYLNMARDIQRIGGPKGLLKQLWNGEYAEANRHPLYPALLSVDPTLRTGKLLSTGIGGAALVVVTLLIAWKFNWLGAGVTSILLATNFAWCFAATHVACEGLLALFCSLAWILSVPTHDDGERIRRENIFPHDAFLYLGVGVMLGLAYLTKGTGPLFLGGYFVWLFFFSRVGIQHDASDLNGESSTRRTPKMMSRMISHARAALLWFATRLWRLRTAVGYTLLGWAVIASPLLARNVQRYGNPIYNVNSYLLFTEDQTDLGEMQKTMTVAEAARRYLASRSLKDLLFRELRGLVWETFIFIRSLGPTPLDDSRILFGAPLFILSLVGCWRRRDAMLSLIWLVTSLLVFAWYVPIAAGERFLLPLLIPLLTYAAWGAMLCASLICRRRAALAPMLIGAMCVAWALCWTIATFLALPMPGRFG